VGLRADLDGCGKSRRPPLQSGFDLRTVQPVASRLPTKLSRPYPIYPEISQIISVFRLKVVSTVKVRIERVVALVLNLSPATYIRKL
jgi:hypothetical protein